MTSRSHGPPMSDADEQLALLIRTLEEFAIFLLDPQGDVASWNEGAERLLGYRADEVIGRSAARFFATEDRESNIFERELRLAAANGRSSDENWLVARDGKRFWASGVTTALRDDDGQLRGFAKIFRDMSEQKAVESALQEKELRLSVALSAARMGTWHWDLMTNRQLLDENLTRLLGLEGGARAETLEEFLLLIHPEDRDRVQDAFVRAVEDGAGIDTEFRVLARDGSIRWLKDRGDVVHDREGSVLYLTGACMDITERKHLEQELERQTRDLADADRRKDEFLAMLGHELRNPLAPLRGVTDLLRSRPLAGAPLEQVLAVMDRQVTHLTRLVDDLLDVSRITRGLIELEREPVELARLVEQALEMSAPLVEARRHRLTVSLPDEPLTLEGDPTRLTQVLFNLVTNAAKYTEPGGHIEVSAERVRDEVEVRVRDDGAGMAPEMISRAFDLFTQGARSADRSSGGLGLGLPLVRRLVEMHGGRVEARSEGEGLGSELIVRLPLAPPGGDVRGPGAAAPEATTRGGALVERVLVVDDNRDAAVALELLLHGLASDARVAHDGEGALRLARAFRPQVVLLDIGLPGLDGYGVARHLRAELGPDALLVAVTGYGQESDRERAHAAGFDLHLVKPVHRDTLAEVLRSTPLATVG